MLNPHYMPYTEAATRLGVSQHAHQVARRRAAYPAHFTELNGELHISRVLYQALADYQLALRYLITLKQQGGSHEAATE